MFDVPQGSLFGPMQYTLYTKEIETIAGKHKISVQMYADDTQLYTSFTAIQLLLLNCKLNHVYLK